MSAPFPHPLILGHRGAPADAPENTLRSFALAMEQGADGVELDVQRSADGVPVVLHDPTLDRTTGAHGQVAAHPWSALERLTLAHVPSLEQAAAWAAAAGAWLNVEIKAERVEAATVEVLRATAERVEVATVQVLRSTGLLPRTVISSFDPRIVRRVGEVEPDVLRFLLTDSWDEEVLSTVADCGAQADPLRVDAAHHLALEVLRREDRLRCAGGLPARGRGPPPGAGGAAARGSPGDRLDRGRPGADPRAPRLGRGRADHQPSPARRAAAAGADLPDVSDLTGR
jgi:glycerophosphoryl diester phosphodiesterase